LVGCTSNFIAFDKADNDIEVNNDDDVNDDDNNDNFEFLDGKHSTYNIYGVWINCFAVVNKLIILKINTFKMHHHQQVTPTNA
jgi:hypothetical protein